MLSQCIHISYYHIFPTTQCHGHHYICRGRNRESERSSNLPKGKRKQILLFESSLGCARSSSPPSCREGCLGAGRLVSAVTQRVGAELAPSRPGVCLRPAPTAPSRVPKAPHLGRRPPGWGPHLCAAPRSPFSLLDPQGCARGPGRLQGTLTCPCRAPGEQRGFRRPEDAGSSAPGSPPPGPPGAAWIRSRALRRGRARTRHLLLAWSQAPAAPLRRRPWGPSPPPRSRVSPEQPRERPQALKLGSHLRPELSALPTQRSQRCFVTRTILWGVEPSLRFHGRASRLQPSPRMRIKNTTRPSQRHR